MDTTIKKITTVLTRPATLLWLWIILAVISALTKMQPERCNNFLIFRGVFWHTMNQTSLYQLYPHEYFDLNHYGPFFSLIIAPFAVMPHPLGLIFWLVMMTLILFVAIRRLPIGQKSQIFILWFCAHELLTALFMQQFNIVIAAIIILSYYFVEKERDEYATLFIVIGTLVKLYGIVGLAFFFFSKHKVKYVASLIVWSILLFCLPMLISSPEYQIGQFQDWIECLGGKNADNELNIGTNISLLGMIRKWGYVCSVGFSSGITAIRDQTNIDYGNWWVSSFSDIWVILSGIVVMALGYFRMSQWKNIDFRLTVLSAVMMFLCLFSTGTESSGYITALIGCVLWYVSVPWQRSGWDIALLVFAFILTSMSPSDLFPEYVRHNIVQPLALKALPVTIIWVKLCYELITKDYSPLPTPN